MRVQRSFGPMPLWLCAGARVWGASSLSHSVPAHDRHSIPQQRHAHRARSAAARARQARASTRATHESAWCMDRAWPRARARPPREGGPAGSARPTARRRVRAAAGVRAQKTIQNYLFSPPNIHRQTVCVARGGGDGAGNRRSIRSDRSARGASRPDRAHTPSFQFVFVVHTMDAMSGAMQLSRG